jgi:hypothetical protein
MGSLPAIMHPESTYEHFKKWEKILGKALMGARLIETTNSDTDT